jgi:hypothetical protein
MAGSADGEWRLGLRSLTYSQVDLLTTILVSCSLIALSEREARLTQERSMYPEPIEGLDA